ncbi:type II secretion system protein [Propionivibrio sp.]|uniref:pilus assembly FimT family protein n=1 Tax=Propionivibrio sp. TaxID=2212460 RepID=UPI002639DA7A|nr:type II secretion system protein [Propionivibrio sp.]
MIKTTQSDGFTLVELVTVLAILGVLAVVVIPRTSGLSDYRALEFHDNALAALRHGQKSATSHRRLVCVAFTTTSVTLTIARVNPAAVCSDPLLLPGSDSNSVLSNDVANALFDALPADFNFQPDGSAADRSLAVAGRAITVVGSTGNVY